MAERLKSIGKQLQCTVHVLLVDDDKTSLEMHKASLEHCGFNVTAIEHPITAVRLLKERKVAYDLVISEVHMPDLNGFELAEYVQRNLEIPVVRSNAGTESVVKGVRSGARDFLVNPIQTADLKYLFQHVLRNKKFGIKKRERGGTVSGNVDSQRIRRTKDTHDTATKRCSAEEEEGRDDDDDVENHDTPNGDCVISTERKKKKKKQRFLWTVELKKKFIQAVDQIGLAKASPKRIMEFMNVPGLSRLHISSHLQKYRLYIRGKTADSGKEKHFPALNDDDPFTVNGVDRSVPTVRREQVLPSTFQSAKAPEWRLVIQQNIQGPSVAKSMPEISSRMNNIPHTTLQTLHCNDSTVSHSNQNERQRSSRKETFDATAIHFGSLDEIFSNAREVSETEREIEGNFDQLLFESQFMGRIHQSHHLQEPYVPIVSGEETFLPSDPLEAMKNTRGGGDYSCEFAEWMDILSPWSQD